MFTGLIEDVGQLLAVQREADSMVLRLGTSLPASGIALGDSVAVNGVCLTATAVEAGSFSADVSHETLAATSLGGKRPGDRVHLERALAMGGRLGGHLVTGHVDGLGEVTERRERGKTLDVEILAPADLAPFLVSKGSVAVDGVSLTVNDPRGDRFRITLVPHTLSQTALADLRPGSKVNLEADILGKYIAHFLNRRGQTTGKVDASFLAEHGFWSEESDS